jgi:hypothetical protein
MESDNPYRPPATKAAPRKPSPSSRSSFGPAEFLLRSAIYAHLIAVVVCAAASWLAAFRDDPFSTPFLMLASLAQASPILILICPFLVASAAPLSSYSAKRKAFAVASEAALVVAHIAALLPAVM